MRIIGGELGGRLLKPPKNLPVRPTTDLAKESLFNVLNNHFDFEGLKVLDLFAGTGSISFEFASRGCASVLSIDKNFKCIDYIKTQARSFELFQLHAVRADVFQFLKHFDDKFDIIFADPPYDLPEIATLADVITDQNILNKNAWLIIEHPVDVDFTRHKYFRQQRNYGKVNFSVFSPED